MKKFLNFILSFTVILSLTGCGDSTAESNVAVSSYESSASVDNNESEEKSATEEATTQYKKPDYINMHGVKVAVPSLFDDEKDASYWTTYSGSVSTNDRIYYSYDDDIMYGGMASDMKDYTYKDVPEILYNSEIIMVNDFFDYLYEKNVETEKETEVNGFPFLRQTGTFKVKFFNEDVFHDVYFIGYYGCMNLEYTGGTSVPMMWLVYSEITDEATKKDMADIIDSCTAQAVFIEE